MRFGSYQTQGFQDEMFDASGVVRPEARLLLDTIESLEDGQLVQCQQAAERLLLQMGITFNVYGDSAGAEPAPAEMLQMGVAQDRLNHAIITLSAFAELVMEA